MDKYHVCYLLGTELCTGANVFARNYVEAIQKFDKKYPNRKIIYVTMIS